MVKNISKYIRLALVLAAGGAAGLAVAAVAATTELGRAALDPECSFIVETAVGRDNAGNPTLHNRMLELLVRVAAPTAKASTAKACALVGFDARMPEHNHGMVVTPQILPRVAQGWPVHGVKFHMRGSWELRLKVEHGGLRKDLNIEINVD